MKIVRRAGVLVATAIMTLGALGVAAPAQAADTSWGCGGFCRPSR